MNRMESQKFECKSLTQVLLIELNELALLRFGQTILNEIESWFRIEHRCVIDSLEYRNSRTQIARRTFGQAVGNIPTRFPLSKREEGLAYVLAK